MDIKHIVTVITLVMPGATATAQPARQPGHSGAVKGAKGKKSTEKANRRPTGKVVNLSRGAPKPMVTRGYLDLRVDLRRGKLKVLKVSRGAFARARIIPRFTGRYRVLLYSHGLLRDSVSFGFPLTAGAGEPSPLNTRLDRSLARGVSARTTVRVPFDARINRILIKERKSKSAVSVNLKKLLPPPLPLKTRNLRTVTFGKPGAKKKVGKKKTSSKK